MATTQDRINGLLGDLGIKAPVRVATTAAITLSGEQTIDGVAVVAEDRVLVKDQSDQTTNGIYYCQATAWVRAPDFDGLRDCLQGTLIPVATGTANIGTIWRLTTVLPVIGVSNLTFSILTPLTASAFIQTLLDDTSASVARATLGAAALAGLSSQAFATGALTASGVITPQAGIAGTTTNDNAASGMVGEYVSSFVPSGSAVSLTSGTSTNVTSISLTAGDWDIFGLVQFLAAASTNITAFTGGSSLTSGLRDGTLEFVFRAGAFVPGANTVGFSIPIRRLPIAVPTTVYLIASAGFTVSTLGAYGGLQARRRR